MDGWQRVGASNAPSWWSRIPSWSVSFTCSRVVNHITSWERATSTNGGGTILSIGWPNGLSDLVIGSTLNRWPRPPRKKFSRHPLLSRLLRGRTIFFCVGDGDVHAEDGGGGANKGSPQRQHQPGIPGDGDTNQVAVTDRAIGRIKIDPPGTRQVDLHPRMRCTASYGAARVHIGNKNIATDETRGQTKRTRCFHHQYGKISAATTTTLQRCMWTLYPLLTASCIDKLILDG